MGEEREHTAGEDQAGQTKDGECCLIQALSVLPGSAPDFFLELFVGMFHNAGEREISHSFLLFH